MIARNPAVSMLCATLALLAIASACELETGRLAGKGCETANDCPDELVCVQVRPGVGRTCEALALPPEGNFDVEDAGFADYCNDVKPILDTYCVSCHGVPPAGGAPATFRLDTYGELMVPGAQSQAERIYVRSVVTRDMPPGLPLPAEDQQKLTAWFRSGATECAAIDGGVDAGTVDGGAGDGG